MENLANEKIGDIVAKNFRAAAIFSKYGVDFCCGGQRSVQEAASKKSVDIEKLVAELEIALQQPSNDGVDYTAWPIDLLASYVEKTHHRYVREKAPAIQAYLEKLCKVHGDRHPELFQITELFQESAKDLSQHMMKEERVLFPLINQLVGTTTGEQESPSNGFGSIEGPIRMMEHEHDAEGDRFEKIAELTNGYTVPADGCNTYQVTFKMLQEFEQDLHKHIHLENNILFPKSIALERSLN